ncbi:MAG: DUF3089 domain-containing protein [Parvularculaceae bacterium]|nr:DUF3089 domain-containing protein [Parvularculaceae bacterium]
MFWRFTGLALGVFLLAVLIALVLVFQDNIVRFRTAPKSPFQTTNPPPPPEYGARGAWLLWPDRTEDEEAEIFYVHSTTYYRGRRWNAPFDGTKVNQTQRQIAAPNEAGPFSAAGAIYGPRYREATLFSQFTHKYDGLAAQRLAYSDVRLAFEEYLRVRSEGAPIIMVGYGQGGLHVLGLLKEFFEGEKNPLRKHLVAAYIIDQATPSSFLTSLQPAMPICTYAEDVRCVVSYTDLEPRFNEEMARIRNRSLIWRDEMELSPTKGEDFVCVNPLSWTTTQDYISEEHHEGAASATGIGYRDRPPAISKTVGARCENGILIVDKPRQKYLRRGNWFGAKWKAQPFNLFYFDLEKNAQTRIEKLRGILDHEAQFLEPIEESIDLKVSPVNKVPPLE